MAKKGCVSIIIPAYNAAATIDECLESVVKQSYSDLEILLIDDGSTDNTFEKGKEWANRDKRIKLIRVENKGVSRARNLGIREARGVFLSFIDSDDIVAENFIECLVEMIDFNEAQCACVGIQSFKQRAEIKQFVNSHKTCLVTGNLQMELLKSIGGFMANKLYIAKIIRDNSLFLNENLSISEDLVFNFHYFSYCSSIIYTEEIFYFYRQNVSSAFNNLNNFKWFTVIDAYKELLRMDIPEETYNYLCFTYHIILCEAKYRINRFDDLTKRKYILEELKKIKNLYRPNTLKQRLKIIIFTILPRMTMLYRRRNL